MFPLNFNFPYRKKDGSIITMEKALDGAGADLDLVDLDDVAITTPAEGDTLVYDNTAKKWKNSDVVTDILDTIEDIEDTMTENGAHNIIVNNAVSHVDNEVTYTVHDDKSITVTVASTTAADRYVELYHSTSNDRYKAGDKFKLSGGANNTITVLCLLDDTVAAISRGNVVEFTMPVVNSHIQFLLYLDEGTEAQTVTVYPMLTRASDPSNEYTAPAMTNGELTEMFKPSLKNSGLTPTYCSITDGGYYEIGNLVIVQMRISNSSDAQNRLISGLPSYGGSYNRVSLTGFDYVSNTLVPVTIDRDGLMTVMNTTENGAFITGCYIKG